MDSNESLLFETESASHRNNINIMQITITNKVAWTESFHSSGVFSFCSVMIFPHYRRVTNYNAYSTTHCHYMVLSGHRFILTGFAPFVNASGPVARVQTDTAQTRMSVCPVLTFCGCHLVPLSPPLHNLQVNVEFTFIVHSALYRTGRCVWSHIYQSNLHNIKI